MTTKEVLIQARALILKGWTQEAFARDADGEPVSAKDPDACSWCVVGAVVAAYPDWDNLSKGLWDFLGRFVDEPCPDEFNDLPETTQTDVLALFDRAIARCNDNKKLI